METVESGEWYVSCNERDGCRYGICLRLSDGGALRFDDVTVSSHEADWFLKRVVGEQVDAVQVRYLIEDYLAESHTVWR